MNKAEQLIACLEGEIAKRDARIVELDKKYGWALSELAAIKAQDTVGEVVGWYRLDRPYEMTSYPSVCATWHKLGAPVAPVYAAPVSEAKAQGVVQWPEADEIMQMAFEEGQPADDASGYCFELEEFDLFIERLMSDVARLNASPAQQVSVPASRDTLTLAYRLITSELKTLANGSAIDRYKAAQCELRAMIDAPAAPAADAGVTDHD